MGGCKGSRISDLLFGFSLSGCMGSISARRREGGSEGGERERVWVYSLSHEQISAQASIPKPRKALDADATEGLTRCLQAPRSAVESGDTKVRCRGNTGFRVGCLGYRDQRLATWRHFRETSFKKGIRDYIGVDS